jgi:hypothetical protein
MSFRIEFGPLGHNSRVFYDDIELFVSRLELEIVAGEATDLRIVMWDRDLKKNGVDLSLLGVVGVADGMPRRLIVDIEDKWEAEHGCQCPLNAYGIQHAEDCGWFKIHGGK